METITGPTTGCTSNLWRVSATQSVAKTESSSEDESSVAKQGFGGLFSSLASILLFVYRFLYSYNTYNTHALLKNVYDFDFQALGRNSPVDRRHVCLSSSKVGHVTGRGRMGKSYDFAREQP